MKGSDRKFCQGRLLVVALVLGGAIASCGESRVSQCNRLSKVVNQAATEAQSVGKDPKADRFLELSKAATNLEQRAKELEAVKLQDGQLKKFQTQFAQMYRATSQASQALVTAYRNRDIPAGNQAVRELQKSTSREEPLVKAVNQYCAPSGS